MDESPRTHARAIALLAAETNNWDILLRAHIDIMNDRFERRSDGSLDSFNRDLLYLLFQSYCHHLDVKKAGEEKLNKLISGPAALKLTSGLAVTK